MLSLSTLSPPWLLLGGFGLFFFGIRHFSESLQRAAGPRFQRFMERSTANRFLSLLFGSILTVLFHSEPIAAVLSVSLTNSGFLSLYQSIAVLAGTSVGSLFAVNTLNFRSVEMAMTLLFAGVVAKLFLRSRRIALWGDLLFGAGLIFIALAFIEQGFFGIVQGPFLGTVMNQLSHFPLLAVMTGLLFVIFLQSGQSALMLASALISSSHLDRHAAYFIVAGTFLGAPLMAVISSLPGTSTSRRAGVVFLALSLCLSLLVTISEPFLQPWLTHRIFGDFSYLILVQAISAVTLGVLSLTLVGVATRYLTNRWSIKTDVDPHLKFLDFRIISTPGLAIHQLEGELLRMGRMSCQMIVDLESVLYRFDNRVANRLLAQERTLDHLQHEITRFATNLAPHLVDPDVRDRLPSIFAAANGCEQIGDKVLRFLLVVMGKKEERIHFSHVAMNDLKMILAELRRFMEFILSRWESRREIPPDECDPFRNGIAEMIKDANESHLHRLSDGTCSVRGGMLFSELLELAGRMNDNLTTLCRCRITGVEG
ncbi:MAG: Na/Pi cotransporter family protein [Desulfuromonadia bacterium]